MSLLVVASILVKELVLAPVSQPAPTVAVQFVMGNAQRHAEMLVKAALRVVAQCVATAMVLALALAIPLVEERV
jgi:hypothetical protein